MPGGKLAILGHQVATGCISMNLRKVFLLVAALGLLQTSAVARQFEKIVRADGSIEIRQLGASTARAPANSYFRYRDASGVMSFSDRQPANQSYELVRFDCYACQPGNSINWETTPLFRGRYEDLI